MSSFCWSMPGGSGEDENVKIYRQTGRRTDGLTDGRQAIRIAHLRFELRWVQHRMITLQFWSIFWEYNHKLSFKIHINCPKCPSWINQIIKNRNVCLSTDCKTSTLIIGFPCIIWSVIAAWMLSKSYSRVAQSFLEYV